MVTVPRRSLLFLIADSIGTKQSLLFARKTTIQIKVKIEIEAPVSAHMVSPPQVYSAISEFFPTYSAAESDAISKAYEHRQCNHNVHVVDLSSHKISMLNISRREAYIKLNSLIHWVDAALCSWAQCADVIDAYSREHVTKMQHELTSISLDMRTQVGNSFTVPIGDMVKLTAHHVSRLRQLLRHIGQQVDIYNDNIDPYPTTEMKVMFLS